MTVCPEDTTDAPSGSSDRAQARDPFLGRERELAELDSMLKEAAAGRGSALLLRGEPGIGKTALLAQAQRTAAALDIQALACSGVRAEAHLPFAGLHQLLWPVMPAAHALPDGQGDLLRAALGLDSTVVADLYQVALAAHELLATLAAKAPLLVVADDVHWLDRPSADVLAFISRRVAAEPIAIVLASRDGADDPFRASGMPSLLLPALAEQQASALLSRVAPDLAGTAREQLLSDAAGNPLALLELPAARRSAAPLPGRAPVGELLLRSFTTRMADLPAPAQALVSVAAADEGCSLAQLCRVAAAAWNRPVAEADIQPAIDGRLARLDGNRIQFTHPLVGSAVYQSLTVGDRQLIHRALAQVIPADDDRRVWHLADAALGPDDAVAAKLEELAIRAGQRGAVTVAIAALKRAAALVTDKPRQADLMLRASELAAEVGRADLSLGTLARTDAGQLGTSGQARMLIVREAAQPGPDGSHVPIADLVAKARDVHADGHRDLAASLLWTAASRCWWTSAELADRLAVVQAVGELDLPTADPRRVAILSYTVTREHRPGLHRDLLVASTEPHDLSGLRFVASAAENLGDHALAGRVFATAVGEARRQGRLGVIARLQAVQAWAFLWSASLDAAAILASETEQLGGELGQHMWQGAAVLELDLISALRGDYVPAKERLKAQLFDGEISGVRLYHAMTLYALSVAALGVGQYEDAYSYLRRIVDPSDSAWHYGACQWVVGDLAEAAAATGRAAECSALIADLAADLRDHPVAAVRYSVLYADAVLADDDHALSAFEAAAAADPGGSPLAEARLQLAHGGWLRRRRRMQEARTLLSRAGDTFTSLGTTGFAYRAAREFRAAGGVRQSPRRSDLPQLTPQEMQIAQHAASGLSNRQIGEQLFLSHRTVGSHLYHLFPKLGITARAQLPNALKAAGYELA
jgi:DNA-binding CsgD family transcriptional regulator